MNPFHRIARRLGFLFSRNKLDREMIEEMRFHLEQRTEDNVANGASPNEASDAARRKFGNVSLIQEHARDQRGWVWVEQVFQDLSYGSRSLLRQRGFATVSILTLALGIGATTTIFSVVNSLVLKPLPYDHPERIVSAKIEATKTIRSKNREIRLSTGAPNTPEPVATNYSRAALTPDEVNSRKLQFAENPEEAIDSVIKRKTGKTLEELAQDSNEGKRARQELEAEATGREFVETTPEYYPTRANYEAIVKWISRYKMNRICNESNFGIILGDMYDRGLWNIPGINEAFEDLRDNGLLDLPPLKPAAAIAEEVEEIEEEVEKEPQFVRESVPQVVRRPRPAAGLGIRSSEARGAARNTAPEKTTVTQQDLDNLSDKEIEVLMAQMRKQPREAIKESLERSRSK